MNLPLMSYRKPFSVSIRQRRARASGLSGINFAANFGMARIFGLFALCVWSEQCLAQTFVYNEPNNPSCPVIAAPASAAPKIVKTGVSVAGSIRVRCGFNHGSYTVILSATDPKATFSPKTFLVNFGSLAGTGAFAVTFATEGEQTISATITSNMGSPVVPGQFKSFTNILNVVRP